MFQPYALSSYALTCALLSKASLRAQTLDFRRFDSSRALIFKDRNSQVHGRFPGKFEPTNLGLEILSMETGRTIVLLLGHCSSRSFASKQNEKLG